MNSYSQAETSSTSSEVDQKVNRDVDHMQRKRYVKDSRLTGEAQLKQDQCPVVYSDGYNISCLGLERLHPFDAKKWGNIHNRLLESGKLSLKATVVPIEASSHDLKVVHTEKYLHSLKNSVNVARIVEVLHFYARNGGILFEFRLQTGGTVLAAELALKNGWAINIGGGFHHASSSRGGGFCVYADISMALQFLFLKRMISKAMIIDLDAHQGNGHENDFREDARVYIFDMFNFEIYPRDSKAKDGINRSVKLKCGTSDAEYLRQLSSNLSTALQEFIPDLVVYNAGTDCLVDDPLGLLNISADGILKRDEMVFAATRNRSIPIAMVTSGGYLRASANIVADSILNLHEKELIQLRNSEGVYGLASLTNRLVPEVKPVCWPPGVYGFGNSPRSHPFKKVVHGEQLFEKTLESLDLEKCSEESLIEELLKIGTDKTNLFPDEQVEQQTVFKYDEGYKHLCSLFVRFPKIRYGTRSHSILLVDNEDKITFFEKRMITFPHTIEEAEWETTVEKFQIMT